MSVRLLLLTAVALVLNLVAFAIGTAADATWDVGQPSNVGIPMVAAATVLPMLLGFAILTLAARRWPLSQRRLAWGGLIFALAGSPMGFITSHDAATGIALGFMHVTTGAAWFLVANPRKSEPDGAGLH